MEQYYGDLKVIERLREKARLIKENSSRHEKIRTLLIVLSGVMRGVWGGGQVSALEELNLTHVFDNAVGISTGAPTVAYFLSKQAHLGTSIYYQELPAYKFISPARILVPGREVVDIDKLCRIFKGELVDKKLNIESLKKNRANAFALAVNFIEARQELLPLNKDKMHIIESIRASIAVPGLYKKEVFIGGKRYIDGASFSSVLSAEDIIRFKPSDVLILANRPADETPKDGKIYKTILRALTRNYPARLREKIINEKHNEVPFLKNLTNYDSFNTLILWGHSNMSRFEMNPERLKNEALAAKEHSLQLFEKYS